MFRWIHESFSHQHFMCYVCNLHYYYNSYTFILMHTSLPSIIILYAIINAYTFPIHFVPFMHLSMHMLLNHFIRLPFCYLHFFITHTMPKHHVPMPFNTHIQAIQSHFPYNVHTSFIHHLFKHLHILIPYFITYPCTNINYYISISSIHYAYTIHSSMLI